MLRNNHRKTLCFQILESEDCIKESIKMKYLGVLALVVVAACVAVSDAQSHNFVWGSIAPGARLLQQNLVTKKGKLLRVVTEDISFPQLGMAGVNMITGIKVTDQYTNGKGGYASLLAGGPGFNNVKIHLKSQRGHGLKFLVEIYGH